MAVDRVPTEVGWGMGMGNGGGREREERVWSGRVETASGREGKNERREMQAGCQCLAKEQLTSMSANPQRQYSVPWYPATSRR